MGDYCPDAKCANLLPCAQHSKAAKRELEAAGDQADLISFKGCLLGAGNPLLDISANVGQELLDKYGLKLNNAILAEESHRPLFEELVANHEVEYIAGGATQNSIRVAQWMLQEPEATGYIGCIGKDSFGRTLRECATRDGVTLHYLEDEKETTGTCAVLIKDKERSLVANLAAANKYVKDHFDSPAIQGVVQAARVVYSAGFFLTVSPETAHALGAHCAATNKIFSINLSAPFITQFFTDPLMTAIKYCDFVFGNESEALAFGEKQGYEDKTIAGIANKIAALPKENPARPRVVVITQGAEPTLVANGQEVLEFPVDKIPKEEIVDSNGAGDSFVGGFLAGVVRGAPLEVCVQAGHYAAGVILRVSGCAISGKPALCLDSSKKVTF
jgi:adenosine kinase